MTETAHSPEKKRAFETYELTVGMVEDLTPRVKGIRFQYPEGKSMSFRAGQFVQIFVPGQPKPRRTSYSIASSPHIRDYFELCVTLVEGGKSSGFLHSLKEGDQVTGMGPLGLFTLPEQVSRDLVFVATGSGIAPFRSMINDLLGKKIQKSIYLVYGNRYTNDIIYRYEWEDLAKKNNNFKVQFNLSRPEETWKGKKGYVQDMIADFVPNVQDKDYYICGLVKMIDAVTEKLSSLGVPKGQVHFERYD